MSLVERFAAGLEALRLRPGRALVAVSGGVDSVVLLDLLLRTRARHGLDLIVAHADHEIAPGSAEVAREVEAVARRSGLPVLVGRLGLGAGASETRARRARQAWLREARKQADARYLVLAHQRDDQRETALMRFLRGSGPAGLAGMPVRRGMLVRPLLAFSRRALVQHARAHGLQWHEDPANAAPEHLRSWLRTALLPRLEARLPDLPARLDQGRRHAAEARGAMDRALERWPGLDAGRRRGSWSLSWEVLRELPEPLALELVGALLRRAGAPPARERVRRALRALHLRATAATADLGGGWTLERSVGTLRVVDPRRARPVPLLHLDPPRGQAQFGDWVVSWSEESAPAHPAREGNQAWFTPGPLALRAWRPGDWLRPLGGRGSRLAVRCFQEARIPAGERAVWPVVEAATGLAWIAGVCRGTALLPEPGAPSLRVHVRADT